MIDTRPRPERVVLVGAARRGTRDAQHIDEHLDELASLADTAGAQVVGRLSQRVVAPASRYYIGEGKVEELRSLAQSADASLVVFDEELSPAQGKNLEAALELRVMDRAELILDIFATRARSREARMQVELAQLEYLLPRLARMWVHLSRIRGGIGLRGPGETQLETDRRMIRKKIGTLKEKLEHVTQHRAIIRRGQRDLLTAVLVGYTNAGKSSLLRALTGAEAFVENRLFATLDTLTREVEFGAVTKGARCEVRGVRGNANRSGSIAGPTRNDLAPHTPHLAPRLRLIDTVGFIRKLPHNLVASFRATLEEVQRADILLHVIDASHAEWEDQAEVVNRTLAELAPEPHAVDGSGAYHAPRTIRLRSGQATHPSAALRAGHAPIVHVFNKMDLLPEPDAFRARVAAHFDRAVFVSAAKGEVGELVEVLSSLA
ncbi:MAG: GTPase HflX [Gemmatimonadetes bacterium]|nr:GTPase HflX [Gemmatimonadota bacterium]